MIASGSVGRQLVVAACCAMAAEPGRPSKPWHPAVTVGRAQRNERLMPRLNTPMKNHLNDSGTNGQQSFAFPFVHVTCQSTGCKMRWPRKILSDHGKQTVFDCCSILQFISIGFVPMAALPPRTFSWGQQIYCYCSTFFCSSTR